MDVTHCSNPSLADRAAAGDLTSIPTDPDLAYLRCLDDSVRGLRSTVTERKNELATLEEQAATVARTVAEKGIMIVELQRDVASLQACLGATQNRMGLARAEKDAVYRRLVATKAAAALAAELVRNRK